MATEQIEIRDLRQHDWIWASKVLLFHEDVDAYTFKVYCGLSSYAENKTQQAFPSVMTLARKLHIGRNTVIRSTQKLEQLLFLKVDRSNVGGHNVYYLLNIAGDEPVRIPKIKKTAAAAENWVKEILLWAETKKGAKFVNYGKQIGALGAMQKSGYTPDDIKACYELMEKNEFWRSRGFDFTSVTIELPKKVAQIRQSHGIFEHLITKS